MIVDYLLNTNSFSLSDISAEIILFLLAAFFAIWVRDLAHGLSAKILKLNAPPVHTVANRISLSNLAAMGILLITGMSWLTPCRTEGNRGKRFLSSLSGPLANGIFCILFLVIYRHLREPLLGLYDPEALTGMEIVWSWILSFLLYSGMIHLSLALFNLIPIPGFDGGMIVDCMLTEKAQERWQKAERATVVLGILTVLLLSRSTIWQNILNTVMGLILN